MEPLAWYEWVLVYLMAGGILGHIYLAKRLLTKKEAEEVKN